MTYTGSHLCVKKGEKDNLYTCLYVHKFAWGGGMLNVAASEERNSEAGGWGRWTLTFYSIPFCTFWILYHLLTVSIQK